jgi:tripartite-type tricarboxylate transporter receptor subunit TctC
LQKKLMVLLVTLLLITLIMGGCSTMENKTVATTSSYPDKPITLIVPFGVGGGIDLVARVLEKSASKHLGQPLVVINKPGGTGTIGWNEVVSATPDGYTLGMTGIEILLQPLYGPTKYHYPSALEPIAQITELSLVMAVQSDQPWNNIGDLIEYAKQHPGQIKFGHPGMGGINHVMGETLAKVSHTQLEQVPFQSGAEAMANLLGGHVQVVFLNPAAVKEHLKSGKVKALAIGGEKRLTDPIFANIPTFREQGLDVVCNSWNGIAAPKGLPDEVKNKLNEGLKKMFNDPEFQKNMDNLGLQVTYLGPKESAEKWLTDSQKLTQLVQEAGIVEKIKGQKK